eukprot:scpid78243/ scgid2731/ 
MCRACHHIASNDPFWDWKALCNLAPDCIWRINVTTKRCDIQLQPVKGCITVYYKDFFEGLDGVCNFSRLRVISFYAVKFCPHHDSNLPSNLPRDVGAALAAVPTQLKVLYLTKCNLCDECIKEMSLDSLISLEEIMLSGNSLTEFPVSLYNLGANLHYIDLSCNACLQLQSVEHFIADRTERNLTPCLPGLQEINISNCELQYVPNNWLSTFPNLISLSFDHNALKEIPGCLGEGLRRLRRLVANHNCIVHADVGVLRKLASGDIDYSLKHNREDIEDMIRDWRRRSQQHGQPADDTQNPAQERPSNNAASQRQSTSERGRRPVRRVTALGLSPHQRKQLRVQCYRRLRLTKQQKQQPKARDHTKSTNVRRPQRQRAATDLEGRRKGWRQEQLLTYLKQRQQQVNQQQDQHRPAIPIDEENQPNTVDKPPSPVCLDTHDPDTSPVIATSFKSTSLPNTYMGSQLPQQAVSEMYILENNVENGKSSLLLSSRLVLYSRKF